VGDDSDQVQPQYFPQRVDDLIEADLQQALAAAWSVLLLPFRG
jgi:hypothetical protein